MAVTPERESFTTGSWVERYSVAQSMLLGADVVANGAVFPHWIDDDHFWYTRSSADGIIEYRVVEAASGAGYIAFTKPSIAEALGAHLGVDVDTETLMLHDVRINLEAGMASFNALGGAYAFDFANEKLSPTARKTDVTWLVSPDGRSAVFLRDHNVWLRDIETEDERPLTIDGTADYAYADRPACRRQMTGSLISRPPEGRWSSDSRHFLTLQVDDRHVPELFFIEFAPKDALRPRVVANKTSLPPDPKVTEFRMISIDVETGKQTEARYPRLSAVRINDAPFSANLAWWGADSRTAYFVDIERAEKVAHVVAFDVVTGATSVAFSEAADTYVELSESVYAPALVHPLPATNELIWFSERSGHGHLYLYDLSSCVQKGAITSGPWQVREIQQVDAARREVFFTSAGIAPDEEPYLCKPCIASLDGGEVRVLSEEPGEHIVWRPGEFQLSLLEWIGDEDKWTISGVSPNGTYFIETVGAADRLPRTTLRRRTGEEIAVIEVAEDRGLPAAWSWPKPVKLTAADGVTDVYGLLFEPWRFDESQSYPVIDFIWGGPALGFVPKSAFARGGIGSDMQYLEAAHLSALGAFVLVLDGRGTGSREPAFREASYRAFQTTSNLEDHISAIRQLGERYPSMDLEHVGICGFSGGGYASALAALRFGDFFKVAVAGGGNYDQSLFWHCWGERYHGPFEPEHYAVQAVKTYASGLTGKLMLIHGLVDAGCHPAALFQLVQALIEQNKDVDLVLMPRAAHELTGYGTRRRLDYFVTHLFGSTPPSGVNLTTAWEVAAKKREANRADELGR